MMPGIMYWLVGINGWFSSVFSIFLIAAHIKIKNAKRKEFTHCVSLEMSIIIVLCDVGEGFYWHNCQKH